MRKIKLYITASIDGYIASPDGDMDWLTEYPNPQNSDYGFRKFLSEIDTVIMGGQTYRSFLCMDIVWPYKDKTTYIITRSSVKNKLCDNIYCLSGNVIEEISLMKEQKGDDIGLVGGGELINILLQSNLIDEMIISTVPILLGGGIPLFSPYYEISRWHINDSKLYENGLLQTVYKKVRS